MRRIVSATGALIEVITVLGLAVLVFRIVSGSPQAIEKEQRVALQTDRQGVRDLRQRNCELVALRGEESVSRGMRRV